MRFLLVTVCLLFPFAGAFADDNGTVEFAGEHFKLGFSDLSNPVAPIAEFVRDGETVDNWRKLIGFFHFPKAGDDPLANAKALAAHLVEKDPTAKSDVIQNPDTGEVLLNFITSASGSDVVEFDVFKYARSGDEKGLVAFQYAEHVKLGEMDAEAFSKLRDNAIKAAADFDIDEVNGYFGE